MNAAETEAVRNFIIESCDLSQLANDCDIFETKIANSLFSIELMTFIESELSVKITTDDLGMANFCSINAIERFVESKRA